MSERTFSEVMDDFRHHIAVDESVATDPGDIYAIEARINKRLADELNAAHKREIDEMLDALVRIGNWCAQDLAENAYVSDSSGNYLKTLNGLCEVCRPFMQKASKLKRYGGVE